MSAGLPQVPPAAPRAGVEVRARGIVIARGGRRILDGVDVDLAPGQVLAVIGPSGAGKSTLLAVLAGLARPDGGTVEVRGPQQANGRAGATEDALHDAPPDPAPLRPEQVGIVFQGYALLPVLTATENVELPLQLAGVDRDEVVSRAAQSLARAGLADIPDRLAEELSGGQRQRVAVARGLVVEAGLVLADEPTSELDAETAALVLAALRAEAAAGAAVVVATNDPEVAAVCDSVLHLHDGRVLD